MTDTRLKIDIRRSKILEILKREGKVFVTELSRKLDVTPVTIRCDLGALEREGHLERISGGAILSQRLSAPTAAEGENTAEKEAIARAIVKMISDGDTVFINSGTTAMMAARELKRLSSLKIVTNYVAVATVLSDAPSFRVIMLGGELNARYGFTYGHDAQDKLRGFHADFAILSVDGISADGGITTYHAEEAIIDRMMIHGADEAFIVADSTKVGRAGFMRVHDSTLGIHLVTGKEADKYELDRLSAQKVIITTA